MFSIWQVFQRILSGGQEYTYSCCISIIFQSILDGRQKYMYPICIANVSTCIQMRRLEYVYLVMYFNVFRSIVAIHVSYLVLRCIQRYLYVLSQYMYLRMYCVVFILGTNGQRNTCIVEMYSCVFTGILLYSRIHLNTQ
jgi:hypothetical protein